MKKLLFIAIFLTSFISTAQYDTYRSTGVKTSQVYTFGKITNVENSMTHYEKDSTANAVVLFEYGNTTFQERSERIVISTKYYKKLKIFNEEGFDHGTFSILIYNNERAFEEVLNIKAITHNGFEKTILSKENIFTEKVNENWKEVKFTMPNLKPGSIVEIEYRKNTPFIFNLTDWKFQASIPKIYSEYYALIPGTYLYNRKLTGFLKLSKNTSELQKKCFRVSGYSGHADCEELNFAMSHIPAFLEEDHMTDKDNFIAKVNFELSEVNWFDGRKTKYTTTWKDVDKDFKKEKDIGGQLKKTKLLQEFLPETLTGIEDELEKAKAVYTFIQDHFTWNDKYSIFKNVRIKKALEEKVGNVGEINISLINALKAAGLDAELLLLSTRKNGLPTKLYPVISDFNYLVAKLNIADQVYLLDATEKLNPFGLLPYRCLNGYGRMMDFENESYWLDIVPNQSSRTSMNVGLEMKEDGSIIGNIRKSSFGYHALKRRNTILLKSDDDVMTNFESQFENLEVLKYQVKNKSNIDKPVVETYQILIENFDDINTLYLNPFFDEQLTENPFKQENRLFPVDFGYPSNVSMTFSIEVPDNYSISSSPGSIALKLPEEGGIFNFTSRKIEDYKLTFKSSYQIKKPIFFGFEYETLKEFFKRIINTHKTPVVIKTANP